MVRLYFTLPTIESASEIADELRSLGVTDAHIHLLSRDDHAAQKAHIHRANAFHVSDAWHMAKQGAVGGLLCGLGVVLLASAESSIGNGVTSSITAIIQGGAIGAIAGMALCFLIGVGRNESKIEQHEVDIEDGQQMLLVDVPKKYQKTVIEKIRRHHNEAEIEAEEGLFHI